MKIIVLDGGVLNPGDISWEEFRKIGELVVYDHTPPELVLERVGDTELLIVNKTALGKEHFEQLPNLKYIGLLSTGYDVVDVKAARECGISVTNIPAYGTNSVAQMVFALILELCTRTYEHNLSVKAGDWSRCRDFCYWKYPLIELADKTLGIIGFGQIGQKTARIAAEFGMNVLVLCRGESNPNVGGVTYVSFEKLMRESDFVSLHCPLNEQTKGIINRQSLSLMKKSAYLINTARGGLVVDEDLAKALDGGTISGAGLDVLSSEPPSSDNPLLGAKNCIITPHIAWASKEARQRLMRIAADNVKSFLENMSENVVN